MYEFNGFPIVGKKIDENAELVTVTGNEKIPLIIDGVTKYVKLSNIVIAGTPGADGIEGPIGDDGEKGWSPVIGIFSASDKKVFKVVNWVGGEGQKPPTGQYIGATGLVTDIADAVQIDTGGASTFADLGGLPAENPALEAALDAKQDKPNQLISGCVFTPGPSTTLTAGSWRTDGIIYTKPTTTTFSGITLSATGLFRTIAFYGDATLTISKVESVESPAVVPPSNDIAGKTLLRYMIVGDSTFQDQSIDYQKFALKADKDASAGYVGLTLFKINFKNALNTLTSFLTNANTAIRTYTFPDKSGTVALLDDLQKSFEVGRALSDSVSDLTTGSKGTLRTIVDFTVTEIVLFAGTAPTGSGIIVDVKKNGTTIFSTKISIASTSTTSIGGTAYVLASTPLSFLRADKFEVIIDQTGSVLTGKEIEIQLKGIRI